MQTPIVTEINRAEYFEAQRSWHAMQVKLVRESLLRTGDPAATRADRPSASR
jgi:hypothetical protein